MKLKPAAILTTVLLLMILGAGAASAYISYKMGTLAVKGVSQPESNPTRKLANPDRLYQKPQPFKPLDEKTILVKVYNHIHDYNKQSKGGTIPVSSSQHQDSTNQEQSLENDSLSLTATDDNITLEVSSVKEKETDLVLSVSLTNQSDQAVQFLYSFLEVRDNKGERLGAIVENLPETIPANGDKIEGVIKIPINLVDENTTLSLNLTDYPEQKRNLMIQDIPVQLNSN